MKASPPRFHKKIFFYRKEIAFARRLRRASLVCKISSMRVLFIPAFPLLTVSAFQLFSVSAFSETFPAANGLERSLVVEQPLLKNPVSVSVDTDGTIYVTETQRRKVADLDIREFEKFGWVPRDVSHTSIEDKQKFFREQLDGKNKFPGTSIQDRNKDGEIDVRDLTSISEKIIRITDKDGDGKYDTSNVFAEDFNTEVTGIAAGTLAWRGDVYATIAPDMWKLRDTDGDGKADARKSLAHGFGVHIAYAGHDMHGLTLGPDGRIYWSIGDKGTNVTREDGKKFHAPHEGAVLRCNPDGTGFEIFARGLRNPQEIAFDQYGNLFSVDNDSDQKGERERFLHITEASDTGWRNYYQYRGSDYNPWMAESIWEPSGKYQPAYITPTNANYSDGPAGFAFNPGTALNEKYHNAFFVTEFPKGDLRSFKVKPKGATFEMTDEHVVYSGPMNVGINFGPDGALYSADWAGGYPLNEKGAIWKLDDPSAAQTAIRKEVAKYLKDGPGKTPTTDLVKQLSHPDQRIRLDAQWELVKREAKTELLATAAADDSDEMAVIHSLWGLTQMKTFDLALFTKLSESKNAELRAQSLRYAADSLRYVPELEKLVENSVRKMLSDESSRIRYFAAMAVWKLDLHCGDHVVEMLSENGDKDAYLRHAGVMALTSYLRQDASRPYAIDAPENKVDLVLKSDSPAVRLAAVVALRRLESPYAAEFLPDADPQVVSEAAHAIYDDPSIRSAYPALADLIRVNLKATVPAARRSIAANRYLADAASATRLAEYAANDTVDTSLRIAALEALASWTEASELNPVDGRYDPLKPADAALAKTAYQPYAAALQHHPDKAISKAASAVSKNLGITSDPKEMEKDLLDPKADPAARLQALDSLEAADPAAYAKILPDLLKDESAPLRTRAAALLAEKDPAAVTAYAEAALAKSKDIPEQQQAVLLLGKLKPDALKLFVEKPEDHPALMIEISEASPTTKFKTTAHQESLIGGDAEIGQAVFNENLAAACVACHRVGKEGSDVGPALTEVGKKGREYILESLVSPQAKITPGFGMISVKTKTGTTLSGALKEENAKTLTLILPDKSETTVTNADIETRSEPLSVMPPMGDILTPRQLRDVVEYLSSLK